MTQQGKELTEVPGDYFYDPENWDCTYDDPEMVCAASDEVVEIQTLNLGSKVYGFDFTQGVRIFATPVAAEAALQEEIRVLNKG